MNSQSASQLFSSIDKTISDINGISGSNILTDSYLAKFLVVYICGVYEEIIESILVDFVHRCASRPEIVEYARISISRSFQNPNSGKLIELTSKFGNDAWMSALKSMTTEAFALDSIASNKNSIAHGGTSVITLPEVIGYYQQSRPLIEKFDELLA